MILNYEMIIYQAWMCLTCHYFLNLVFAFVPLSQYSFVLQSLEFDLIVYAPYRSVEGFINVMEVSFIYLACFPFCVNL